VPSSVDCRSTGLENPETTGVSVTLFGGGGGGGGGVVVLVLPPHAARTSTKPNAIVAAPAGNTFHITIEIRSDKWPSPTQLGRVGQLAQKPFRGDSKGMDSQKVFLTAEWRMLAILNYGVLPNEC